MKSDVGISLTFSLISGHIMGCGASHQPPPSPDGERPGGPPPSSFDNARASSNNVAASPVVAIANRTDPGAASSSVQDTASRLAAAGLSADPVLPLPRRPVDARDDPPYLPLPNDPGPASTTAGDGADDTNRITGMGDAAAEAEQFTPDGPVVLVLGAPGSGKDTQCDRLVQKLGGCHLSTVDLVREAVESKTTQGTKISNMIRAGQIPTAQVYLDLL